MTTNTQGLPALAPHATTRQITERVNVLTRAYNWPRLMPNSMSVSTVDQLSDLLQQPLGQNNPTRTFTLADGVYDFDGASIDIRDRSINLSATNAGAVDIKNANFQVANTGRIRNFGIHFINETEDPTWTVGNCTMSFVNCTGVGTGDGAFVQSTRDGNAKIDIDPTNDTRENLYDWSAATAGSDIFIGEGNIDLFLRAGKVTGQNYRYRVIVLAPPNARGACYVLRGRSYSRSFLFVGNGTGNGFTLVRGTMGFTHPYQVGTPTGDDSRFREPGFIYSDTRTGCINFDKSISLRSNASLSLRSDNDPDDATVPDGVFTCTGTTGVELDGGELDYAPGVLDLTGCTNPVRRPKLRLKVTDRGLSAYETTIGNIPAAASSNTGAIVKVNSGHETPGSFYQSNGTTWEAVGGGIPAAKTGDFTVALTEKNLINNKSGSTCVVTLPSASSFPGRELVITNWQAQLVNSASSNVVPLGGGAAGTAILAATAGKWALLASDGTNWVTMAAA